MGATEQAREEIKAKREAWTEEQPGLAAARLVFNEIALVLGASTVYAFPTHLQPPACSLLDYGPH
jgi:hypothetical protein